MAEPIVIVLQTFERTENALDTVRAAVKNLRYPDLRWWIADDSRNTEHGQAVYQELLDLGATIAGGHYLPGATYGENANTGWEAARDISRLTLFLEDDWELRQPLDLYPYAKLLMECEEVGMVRLGVLNLDIRGRTWAYDGLVYWKLDQKPHLEGTPVFTGHPSLRHYRYWATYGNYPTDLNPGNTELAYAYKFTQGHPDDPGIVWPADYPASGYFGHIGTVKTETMV